MEEKLKSDEIQKELQLPEDLENETPNFRQEFPRGFAEGFQESILSQESDAAGKSRTLSTYSDHLNIYRSKIDTDSTLNTKNDRLSDGDCKCFLL
jgi:hypothetical protein